MKQLILFFFTLLLFHPLTAQRDSLELTERHGVAAYVITGSFMTAGLYFEGGGRKQRFQEGVRDRFDIPITQLDDVLQHSPIVMMYAIDLMMGTSLQEVGRQTRHMLITQAATLGTSFLLKSVVNSERPNGGELSFPSGHTAYTFASATVLFHSYRDKNMLLALSGYVPAAVVGSYRMIKNKHWISDVLFGAGIGMLFAHLSYEFDIWDSATIRSADKTTKLSLGGTQNGVGLALTF